MLRHFVYKDRLLIQSGSSGFVLVHRCSWSRMGDPWKDSLLDALGGDPQAVVVGRPKARRQPGRRQPAAAAPTPIVPLLEHLTPGWHWISRQPPPPSRVVGGICIWGHTHPQGFAKSFWMGCPRRWDLQIPKKGMSLPLGFANPGRGGCPLRWDLQILEEGDAPSTGICKS